MKVCVTRRQLMAAAGVAALGLCGCLRKEETGAQLPELILRYAENQPEDYPTTQAALAFAQLVEQQTGGRVKVVVYSGGELGAEQSVIQQMQFGGIDFARVSLSPLAGYIPELSILQLPYLYKDADQMWRVLDGSIGDEFLGMLDQMDLVGLSWFDAGVRSFYTREKVTTLEQLQKLTIRVQESDVMSGMIKDLGAKPVQLAYSQVYAALHNGQIDGAENNWPSYASTGHYEGAPCVFLDEHSRIPEMQLMSTEAMDQILELDEDYYTILCQCAREAALYERELWTETEAQAEQEMLEKGCVVTVPDAQTMEELRSRMQPFYEELSEENKALVERIRNS